MHTPEPTTLLNCDHEPIHIPGAIQPFAWLFVLNEQRVVKSVSANYLQQQQYAKDKVLNQAFNSLPFFQHINLDDGNSLNQVQNLYIENERYSVHINPLTNRPAWLTIEVEPHSQSVSISRDPQSQAHNIVSSLVACDNRDLLFDTLLQALHQYVGYDRCMVYQFDEHWNGSVIAEVKAANLEPFLGLHYPATDIPVQARAFYQTKLTRLIADVHYEPATLVSAKAFDASIDLTHVDSRAISPIHIQYLKNMGVNATLVISLMVNGQLWGLIACHHYSGAKYLNYETRKSCETIAMMTALFIERLEAKILLGKNKTLRRKLNIAQIHKFLDNPLDNPRVSQSIMALTHADGVAWFDGLQLRTVGVGLSLEAFRPLLTVYEQQNNTILYIDSISPYLPDNRAASEVAGLCIIGLFSQNDHSRHPPCLVLYRKEANTLVKWAGNPHEKHSKIENSVESLSPRRSFAVWTEVMKERCAPWSWLDKSLIEELQVLLLEAHLLQLKLLRHHELKVIADGSDIGIWSLDTASGLLYWSERMFDIYGVNPAHFDGQYQSWTNCLVAADRENARLVFEKAVHQQKTFQLSFRINHPDKGVRTIRAHADMVLSDSGVVSKVIGTNVDITEELAMSEAIQVSLDASTKQARLVSLGELAATISHEINNPLAIILSNLELQQYAFDSTPLVLNEAIETNKRAMTAAERIMKIVSGLNSLSRKASSEKKNASCHVPSVLSELVDMMVQLLRKDGVVITTDIEQTTPLATIDGSALQQILINLINNAKDAMAQSAEKPIFIKSHSDSDFVYVSVMDQGTGISEDIKQRLFSPFFTTKARGQGTGLGLSIARSLITETGGDLFVESEVGKGALFTVQIPLQKPKDT